MDTPSLGTGHISVMIIDDNDDVRTMFGALAEDDGRFTLIGSLPNAEAGLAFAERADADVIVLDHHMRDLSGFEALPELRRVCPRACIILWSSVGVDTQVAIDRGATTVVDKSVLAEQVLDLAHDLVAADVSAPRGHRS